MRTEEQFAVAALIAWLGGDVRCVAGEDPPDCYLLLDGTRVAVEITQLAPLSFDESGATKNRTSEDMIPTRICDKMDCRIGAAIPSGLTLLLHVHGPLRAPRHFERGLESGLRALIDSGALCDGHRETWELAGNEVEVVAITRESRTGKKIVGAILNHDAVVWLEAESIAGLRDRIVQKESIMARHQWADERWLVLLNAHPFLGPAEYCEAYGKVSASHGFARVILVHRDGSVYDLATS